MDRGLIKDWDAMTKIWQHTFYNEIRAQPDEMSLLITEALNTVAANRYKTAEIMFEHFNVPALQFAPSGLLGFYAEGRTTGVVLDCGHGLT